MIEVFFTPSFIRQYKKLEPELQAEVKGKIELFKNRKNHQALKVHKLHGDLKKFHSFSVNYKTRVVFYWKTKNIAWLEVVGSHDIYN